MKKIVFITSFAESHLLKCLIPNVIETLNPDKIIISEGLFSNGPENKQELDFNFREKWLTQRTNAGFDWNEVIKICQDYDPHLVECAWHWYESSDAVQSYSESISAFDENRPEPGDLIFCLEADSFLLESDREIIEEQCSKLSNGQGLAIKYVDFLETQFYTESCNINSPKYRRFVYKFDTMDRYLTAMSEGFMTQEYPKLQKTNMFFARHYNWFRPEPWKQLRFDLIWRKDLQYWMDFESGLQEIKQMSQIYVDYLKPNSDGSTNMNKMIPLDKITIRPSRQDEGRWAKFIDCKHPKHIMHHKNFIK